ncbi:hypothetical protein NMA510612_0527 [Neisseria meningitidis]|uniref:Uncharacterized protein n=1 Tax=Neisseria meningitidis TaxID=487 RepID=X5F4J3_NEIME|nr:hypothetical protein NMA510612_0527 [Neisseria meningitidis]
MNYIVLYRTAHSKYLKINFMKWNYPMKSLMITYWINQLQILDLEK